MSEALRLDVARAVSQGIQEVPGTVHQATASPRSKPGRRKPGDRGEADSEGEG